MSALLPFHEQLGWLQWNLQRKCRRLLERLREAEPRFRDFADWPAVVHAFWQRLPTTEEDRLLRAIFRQRRKDRSRRWPLVLTALFWPRLLGLHRRYRACDPDPAECWQFLLWAFYRSLRRLNVDHRRERLAKKLVNDSWHDLYQLTRRAYGDGLPRQAHDRAAVLELDADLERAIGRLIDGRAYRSLPTHKQPVRLPFEAVLDRAGTEDDGCRQVDSRDEYQALKKQFRRLLRAGRVSPRAWDALIATEFRGWSQADYARRRGLSYEAVKKLCQRTRIALRQQAG